MGKVSLGKGSAMKALRAIVLSAFLIRGLSACASSVSSQQGSAISGESSITQPQPSSAQQEVELTLAINGEEVPVIWGNNDAVAALREQVSRGAIEVETSPYEGFEQVGSLGKSYPAQDISMTTQCGDIVLYGGQ